MIFKKTLFFIVFLYFAIGLFQNAYGLTAVAKATICVVDENGLPIEGARAGFAFEENKTFGVGVNVVAVEGITDSNGKYTASHRNDNNLLTYGVEKNGYYYSSGKFIFTDRDLIRWDPWNPELKIVMRKIKNPVPMYARDTKMARKSIAIPVVGKKVGFDLIAYDWIAPYGAGQKADLIFYLEKRFSSMNNYEGKLTIAFSNDCDGIIRINEQLGSGSQSSYQDLHLKKDMKGNLNLQQARIQRGIG